MSPRPEIKKKATPEKKETCASCVYYFFKGLAWHCYHPDHDRPLKRLTAKCDKYQSAFAKTMPPHERGYPEPLHIALGYK
jgi:hypothetical protein